MYLLYSNYEPTVLSGRSVLVNSDRLKCSYLYSRTCKQISQPPRLLAYRWNHHVWRTHHSLPVSLHSESRAADCYSLVRVCPSTRNNSVYVRGLYKSHVKYWYATVTPVANKKLANTSPVLTRCLSWFLSYYRSWFRFQLFTCVRYWRYLQFGSSETLGYMLPRRSVMSQSKVSAGSAWWNLTSTLLYL